MLDVTVGINQPQPAGPGPATTGGVVLLAMKTELSTTALLYTRTAPRWRVAYEYNGGGAYAGSTEIPVPLVEGKWTNVSLVYALRTGTVTVAYDGVTVFSKAVHFAPSTLTDSKATVRVGAVAYGPTESEPFRLDNMVARVTRE